MANKKISDLDAIVTPSLSDLYENESGGVSKKITGTQLQTLIAPSIASLSAITTPALSDLIQVSQGGVEYKQTQTQTQNLFFKNQYLYERMLINSDPKYGMSIRADFTEYSTAAPLGFGATVASAGEALSLTQTKGVAGYAGEARTRLQTATGFFWNYYGSVTAPKIKAGLGKLVFEHRWQPSLFNADTGFFRTGLGATSPAAGADEVNGIYIGYDENNLWYYVTVTASSVTKTVSAVSVTAATHICGFEVNSAWNSIEFFVDGVSLGAPITTNIPSTANFAMILAGYKATGNTQQNQYHNYMDLQYFYNTPLTA